ncbi:MAG: release factor glutamine methyltransferase [Bacteroidetes bacterium]|nr:MAG: release factor glutamine methyltransferase [Bacteroidota bacterium]
MKAPTNKITDLIRFYSNELKAGYSDREARGLVEQLIDSFFGIDKLKLIKTPELRLNESEMLRLHFAVKELSCNKPLQYILTQTEFDGLMFDVNENVLIPRPETEELLSLVSNFLSKKAKVAVADIGTGSGCIAISLANRFPDSNVEGFDISIAALTVANQNAIKLKVSNVSFFEMDILHQENSLKENYYDLIVSNPPYVTISDKAEMKPNVLDYEPELALFVTDEDPLIFYRTIILKAVPSLKNGGLLAFEINERFGLGVCCLMESAGFTDCKIIEDLNKKDRFVTGLK